MTALRHADIPLAVLATAWLAWSLAKFPTWTADDAFIVARYADNVVAHGELAFNAGAAAADRVEGFTSPLALVLAVLARAVGGDAVAFTKGVGTFAALAMPLLVAMFARTTRASRIAGGGAALLFAALPEHAIHARSGLETELFVASMLALLIGFAHVLGSGARARAFIVPACVTMLTRPEGLAAVGVLAVGILVVRPSSERRALVRAFALGIALPIAAISLARVAYFGAVLPNTFYAKSAVWNLSHVRDLAALADIFALDAVVIAVAAWALARIARRHARVLPPRLAIATLAAAAILALHVMAYARTAPVMDYGRRFAWHGIALMAVIVVAALDVGVRAALATFRRRRGATMASLAAIAVVLAWSLARSDSTGQREAAWATRQENSVAGLQAPLADWIAKNTAPDTLIAVYPDAGRMPFSTRRPTIDFGKLNDRVLARARTDEEIVRYFFERKPEIIVMGRYASGRLWDSGAEAIVRDPRFAAEYVLARSLPDGIDPNNEKYDIYRRAH